MPRRNSEFQFVPGLAERIKEARIKKGYSIRGIAKALGISQSGYANYELGLAEPSLTVLIRMAELLDASVEELLGISAIKKPETNQKQQILNELWEIIDKVQKQQGRNALYAKNLVFDLIKEFTEFLRENQNIADYPDTDENLAEIENFVSDFNRLFNGLQPYPNPEHRIRIEEGWMPYENVKLLYKIIKLVNEFYAAGKEEYKTKEEYCNKEYELRKRFRMLEDELDGNAFSPIFMKIKEVE